MASEDMNPPPAASAPATHQQVEVASPISSRPPSDEFMHQSSGAAADEDAADRGGVVSGNRWPRQETLALLRIRSEMDATFRDANLKGPLWEHVSRKLGEAGYKRSAKKCKEKFENVHKYYKRTKESGATRHHPKTYKFFSELEALQATTSAAATVSPPQNPISVPVPITSPPPVPLGGGTSFSTNSASTTSPGEDNYDGGRKRKREPKGGLEGMMEFFEGQMKEVLQRQEAMQQRFLEAVEKRDQERTIREEAWKMQETARLARDHHLMAQERAISASRDAAVISFIQKITGQTIPFPHNHTSTTTPTITTAPVPPPAPAQKEVVVMEAAPEQQVIMEGSSPSSSRWPKAEVLALISVRSELEGRYKEAGAKGQLWEEVSAGMGRLGYKRSSKRCKEKWENINKYFKKVKESSKKRPDDAKTCPYFHQLDALYRKKNINLEQPITITIEPHNTNKPEGIVKENNKMEQQQLMVDGYDMNNEGEGEDEEDEDDEYKIEFQRPAPSNGGGGNEPHSFFAMVQ